MVGTIRAAAQALAIPLGIFLLIVGYMGWSYWWVVSVAAITAVGLADQTLGDDNPLAIEKFIPGPWYKNVTAGLFGFAGSLAGFSVVYLIGRFFG
jgi:hypothetical protein